ncbi:MAG: DUF932 domain-containing protein [Halieaceae bacterium]|nr:DUF932 domain-containing protein [Halieaceae bacterium]
MPADVESMAWAGEVPWHGLGTPVSNDLGPLAMMRRAGVDWGVKEIPSYINLPDGPKQTGRMALVRDSDNAILTMVGPNWRPVQNVTAFEFFHEFVMAGGMEMHTAGSLQGGKIVWALAKVKESFEVVKGDQVDSFLLFSNPHQYGMSIDIRFTPIRVVCSNTLAMSLGRESANAVTLNHRTAFDPQAVKQTMGIAGEKFAKYREVTEFLAGKRARPENLVEYYNKVFPHTGRSGKRIEVKTAADLSRNGQAAMKHLESQSGAEYGAGTYWQALNSVTYLTDHVLGRSPDTRLASAWYGRNQARKIVAVREAVRLAKAA